MLCCAAPCCAVLCCAVFQGMGSLVNGCVILICMAMLGLTGSVLDPGNSRTVVMLQFAVGAAVSLFMVAWRYFKLKESKVGHPGTGWFIQGCKVPRFAYGAAGNECLV